MTTKIRLLVCAAAILLPARAFCQTGALAAPPEKGRVLLLENERIFEGDIEKVADQYRVKRLTGGETWVPGEKVMRLCMSKLDAYEYLRKQTNLNDPDEHLRLARWCQVYELREQAVAEVHAALELRPQHAETRRLLANLERTARQAATPSKPAPTPKTDPNRDIGVTKAVASGLELNAECMGLFARRVQPILMNTCADCHASSRAGEFKLTQVFGDAPLGGKSARQNLTAVLSQIKPDQPMSSPLLLMAASAHGGAAQPPLKNRQSPAFRALEQWVQLTAVHAGKTPATDAMPGTREREPKSVFSAVDSKPAVENSKPMETPAAPEPMKKTEPTDEFDPGIFNRQMHPEKK